jgi:hypothetical protein
MDEPIYTKEEELEMFKLEIEKKSILKEISLLEKSLQDKRELYHENFGKFSEISCRGWKNRNLK